MNLRCELDAARSRIANLEHTIRQQDDQINYWKDLATSKPSISQSQNTTYQKT